MTSFTPLEGPMTPGDVPPPGMNDTAVRQLAQSDPVPTMTANFTGHVVKARRLIAELTNELRGIDWCSDKLNEHGIVVTVDLGPVGNQAAAARRDLERQPRPNTFEMPR